MYEPKHLKLYQRPRDYAGPDYFDFYPVAGQSRDSDELEASNFAYIVKALGGESATVLWIRDSHWAVGWVETLYVHKDDAERVKIADELRGRLEDYPVLDQDDFSRREYESAADCWAHCLSVRERVEYIKRHGDSRQYGGPSIFAARRDELPSCMDIDGLRD